MLVSFSSQAKKDHYSRDGHDYQKVNKSYFWQDIKQRLHNQSNRIDKGVKKGQLTHREVKKLRREQKHIAKQIKHFKKHNYLSSRDRHELINHLDYMQDKISDLRHNEHYVHKYTKYYDHKHGDSYKARNSVGKKRYISWVSNESLSRVFFNY